MSYPVSAFTQPQFITHRPVIQHHQPQQQQQQQQQQQPTHVAPTAILSTPPIPQQQHAARGQPTPPGVLPGHPPLSQQQQASASQQPQLALPEGPSKTPYGAGGDDDGYTLVFANMDEFQAWREKEEIEQCVDFVKGDVHGSRAVPPRFREHTKLVCARHVRSGRKKYIKKHPERVRKLPSRKLEGIGCPASISYKTYHDVDTVRACYNSQHSHPTGPENYPFTRRGRKQMANERTQQTRKKKQQTPGENGQPSGADSQAGGGSEGDDDDGDMEMQGGPDDDERQVEHLTGIAAQPPQPAPPPPAPAQTYAQPSVFHHAYGQAPTAPITQPQHQPPPPQHTLPPPPSYPAPPNTAPRNTQRSHPKSNPSAANVSAASLAVPKQPPQPQPQPQPTPPPPPPQAPAVDNSPERWRWERLTAMFEAIKANARGFEYPQASLAALEATLVRLTLESPLGPSGGG